jgi:hypothetical protein
VIREGRRKIAVAEAGLDDVFADDITFPARDGYLLGATLFLPRGHFGFFRPEHRDTLWRGAAEWIQA